MEFPSRAVDIYFLSASCFTVFGIAVTGFGGFIADDWPEYRCFSKLALLVAQICPHAAGIERTWSIMDGIYTKKRNSLSIDKVFAATSIKLKLHRERVKQADEKEAAKAKKLLKGHIADPDVLLDVSETEIPDDDILRLENFNEMEIMESICENLSLEGEDMSEINGSDVAQNVTLKSLFLASK